MDEAPRTEMDDELKSIMDCLVRNPNLKTRVASLVGIFQNTTVGVKYADDAENRVRDETRGLSQQILEGWGQSYADQQALELSVTGAVTKHSKKTPLVQRVRANRG